MIQDCFPFYKKLKKVAKFLSSAKEAAQADQWEDCVDNANRILKNEPDVQNIRFHAYDR
jgi:DnaJ family protein C protein 3